MEERTPADLPKKLRRIVLPERGKGLLPEAPQRPALPESKAEAVPDGGNPSSPGGGRVSPDVEQPYAGSTYYYIYSSDGLTTFEFGHEVTVIDDDGNGATHVTKRHNPNP